MPISKRNRRGIWMLIVLCIALAYVPRVLAEWSHEPVNISFQARENAEKKVIEQQKVARKKKTARKSKSKNRYKAPPSKFNPNDYQQEDWMRLGLSEKQASVVLKFTQRGVRSNEELKKIYVIPEQVFELLKDSTIYDVADNSFEKNESAKQKIIIDINTASLEELKSLPGIGDFYAKKIIEQREALGGYIGTYQLLDLWKFGSERFEKIKDQVKVIPNTRKLNINTADIETLKNHPYISYKVANSIVKMRNAHGKYQKLEDLLESVLIDQELFSKIQPYLTL